MTLNTRLILNGIITMSGLVHMSGLLHNQSHGFYIGVGMITVATISFTIDFFRYGKTFLPKNYLVIKKQQIKQWRMIEVFGIITMIFVLTISNGRIDTIVITQILYFSAIVLLDHKETIEITDKYIFDDGAKINISSIDTIEFRQNEMIIRRVNSLMKKRISLEGIVQEDKDMIKNRLDIVNSTAANIAYKSGWHG